MSIQWLDGTETAVQSIASEPTFDVDAFAAEEDTDSTLVFTSCEVAS